MVPMQRWPCDWSLEWQTASRPRATSIEQVDDQIAKWEDKLNTIGDDAQLANVDLQNMRKKAADPSDDV